MERVAFLVKSFLQNLDIKKSGIGYTPGDLICIEKEDGTRECFSPTIGEFGKIVGIGITPIPITRTPKITTITTTGIGIGIGIITELRPDTPEVDPATVIQITDLAGLKQTGYIEGRPYYGEVFFKDGTRFSLEDMKLLEDLFKSMLPFRRALMLKSPLDLLQFRDLVLMSTVIILDLTFQELQIILFK